MIKVTWHLSAYTCTRGVFKWLLNISWNKIFVIQSTQSSVDDIQSVNRIVFNQTSIPNGSVFEPNKQSWAIAKIPLQDKMKYFNQMEGTARLRMLLGVGDYHQSIT